MLTMLESEREQLPWWAFVGPMKWASVEVRPAKQRTTGRELARESFEPPSKSYKPTRDDDWLRRWGGRRTWVVSSSDRPNRSVFFRTGDSSPETGNFFSKVRSRKLSFCFCKDSRLFLKKLPIFTPRVRRPCLGRVRPYPKIKKTKKLWTLFSRV